MANKLIFSNGPEAHATEENAMAAKVHLLGGVGAHGQKFSGLFKA